MIPAAFDYARASSLTEALDAIADEDTKIICGGQTLVPLLRFRLTRPGRLVDIGQLAELRGVTVADGAAHIGAATTYRELLASEPLRDALPLLAEVIENIGDIQVRNLGTIGGALAHADPSADLPAAMLALGATMHLQSARARRAVPAREFFLSAFETALAPDELLVSIEIPALPDFTGSAYVTFEQPASGYALVGAAAVVTRTPGRGIVRAALAFTGLADAAFLADAAARLVGTSGDADAVERVAAEAVRGIDANADIHANADYRRHLAHVAARRAMLSAIERAR
jgi:aerobic carbon-monoxide dehydrogenase medium subunit